MSRDLQALPPESGADAANTKSPSGKKLTIWQRILQRYRWMSFWNKIALWAFVALVLVTAAGFQYVVPAYRHFKSKMYLNMADKFIEAEDYNSASLAFRKAILSGHKNPEVWKRVAAFLEKVNSPELAKIWETLAELEPDVYEHRIRQAESMLKQGRRFQAVQILDALPEPAKKTTEFYKISAEVALSKRDYAQASAYYAEWLKLEPDNDDIKFRQLVTTMYSPDPLIAYPAKEEVEILAKSGGPAAVSAYRELIARSMQEGDIFDAARLAGRLVDLPNPTFEDMAAFLNLEIASKSFALQIALQRFLEFGKNNPAELPKVANFLLERGQTDAVKAWMLELPPEVLDHQDVQASRFQLALATQDWDSAFALLKANRLPVEVPENVLALAEQSFAEYAAGDKNADQTWQKMIYAVQGNAGALQMLSLMAEARGWTFAVSRTLAALSNLASGNLEVWKRLARHEALTGNLAGYHSALTGMMRINPYDIGVSSDWVLSSVLLRKEDPQNVLSIAERAYGSTYPANPNVATAYAVALLGLNRAAEAKSVIEKMSMTDRMAPERSIYMGAVLAGAGDNAAALEFLHRAAEAGNARFIEELGFRRVWEGIARGESSAEEQLAKIFRDRAKWADDSQRIAIEVQRDIQVRYDPVVSQRILEDLKQQAEQRRSSPAELQKLVNDLRVGAEATPSNP